MKLTMDKNNTMESDGGNEAAPTRQDDREALTRHLLAEGYLVGWKAIKLTMYERVIVPKDHLHSFCKGMKDTTGRKDI